MGTTQQLAQEIIKARFEDVPPAARERARDAILDHVGIAFLGYAMAGVPLVEYAKDVGGRPEATIIGDGAKVSCMVATGVNAQMAQDTDFQETGPGHHALSMIAQTALSVGERVGASGKDIITAVALGYDINGRFHRAASQPAATGLAVSRHELPLIGARRHHIATCAITAAKLLGLDETQICRAITLAWNFREETRDFARRYKRSYYTLGVGHLGVQAALLAQKGFDAVSDLLETETAYNLERLLASPSPYYYTASELHLKPWICSRGVQAGLQSTLEIMEENRLRPEDIQGLTLKAKRLYFDFPHNNPEPRDYWDAIYSVQWTYAMTILGYEPGPAWFSPAHYRDPAVLALARKVTLQEDTHASDVWESGKLVSAESPNEVEVTAKGKVFHRRKTYGEALGSPQNPMPMERLVHKFTAQAAPVIGIQQCEKLAGKLSRLEEQDDIRKIARLLKPL